MKTLKIILSLLLLFFYAASAEAYTIQHAERHMALQLDGNADIRFQVVFTSDDNDRFIDIPLQYSDIHHVEIKFNGEKTDNEYVLHTDRDPFIRLDVNDIKGRNELLMTYTINKAIDWNKAGPGDYRSYKYKTAIENNQVVLIDTFIFHVVLPENWVYHRVTGSIPEYGSKDPKAPYYLSLNEDGRYILSINRIPMKFRDKAALEFIFKENGKKSPVLFIVAVILAGLYLVYFRHLIQRKENDNQKKEDE